MLFLNAHTHDKGSIKDLSILQTEDEKHLRWNSVGIHPWYSESYTLKDVVPYFEHWSTDFTIAVGEAGVDALRGGDLVHQYDLFVEQARLAEELQLPLIIHCVRSWEWILKAYKALEPTQMWIYHGFSKKNLLSSVLNCEKIMISIGASVLSTNRDNTWIREIPDHRLLLETDNANVDINSIYEIVSMTKAISLQDLQKQIDTNFKKTFTKWHIG